MNKKSGFTLIELGIVAIIVGILVLVGIPNMIKGVNRGYAQDGLRNLMAIYAAEQNYAQNNDGKHFPAVGTAHCDLNCMNGGLSLNIVQSGSNLYDCSNAAEVVTCTLSNTPAAFKLVSVSNLSISVNSNPVYCFNDLPNSTYNPCCPLTAGHVPGDACP